MDCAVQRLQDLPAHLRPHRYSANETDERTAKDLNDAERFGAFCAANPYGYFLFADRIHFNIDSAPKHGFCSIVIEPDDDLLYEADAVELLKLMTACDTSFALAACPDEYEHRNRYVKILGANQIEAWVGRDLRKYLPGVYWLTAFSKAHRKIAENFISTFAATYVETDSGYYLVKAYTAAEEWRNHATRIDEWIANEPSIFSKQRILARLDSSRDFVTLNDRLAEWA